MEQEQTNLDKIANERNVTTGTLAMVAGVNWSTAWRHRYGKSKPSLDAALKYAAFFKVAPIKLFEMGR